MEIDGHPTLDLIEELERRGALRADGSPAGPNVEAVRFIAEQMQDVTGFWLFVPRETFQTGMDDFPR
jgi:hypothetical protein